MRRALHIVRTEDPAALPAGVVAEGDVLVYTYVPATPAASAWLLWRDHDNEHEHEPSHVQIIDTAALCDLAFRVDTVVVW